MTLALTIFVGVNSLLYFSPELFASDALQKSKDLDLELSTRSGAIQRLGHSLDVRRPTLDAESLALGEGGNTHARSRVDKFNSAVDTFNADIEQYRSLVHTYNARVDEYNALIKSLPSRAVIFPGLRRSGRTHAAKSTTRH